MTYQKKRKAYGKKQCELGANCPYKSEYQHASEFAHDEAPPKTSPFDRAGQKLGVAAARNIHREPGAPQPKKMKEDKEVTACCDICGMFLPLTSFDAHMQSHEVSKAAPHPSTSLINQQDHEYEAALEADILRLSRESYEAEVAQQQWNQMAKDNRPASTSNVVKEDEDLQKALKLSLETSSSTRKASPVIDLTDSPAATRQMSRARSPSPELSPEPTCGELVMLRFRITCDGKATKLQRSFRLLSTLRSVQAYVTSELKRSDVTVQPVMGSWNYALDKNKTLHDLGVTTNSTLVVRNA